MSDKICLTLVQSKMRDKPYAKVDGKYSGPTWLNDIGQQHVDKSIDALFQIMSTLQTSNLFCMVYGHAIKEKIVNTNRTMKNFEEQPVHHITFDLDDYSTANFKRCGADVTYNQLVEDADYFIQRNLPPEFHSTSYILRLSSSFMVKEDGLLRAHLVFLSDVPQYPREIGLWMKRIEMPADATFYLNLTQPVFTAAPTFNAEIDPLGMRSDYFPRISLVRRDRDTIPGEWLPLSGRRPVDPNVIRELPSVSTLLGKVGSYCRRMPPESILNYLGYSCDDRGRFLAPSSESGLPGTVVFDNGYIYSHHDNDPVNTVIDKIYEYRRRSLNAHDLMYGWAKLNYEKEPRIMAEYEYQLSQAIAEDQTYQTEVEDELLHRCEWLVNDGFCGLNKQIVTGLVQDAAALGLGLMAQATIASVIAQKTAIRKSDIMTEFKNLQREKAFRKNQYDPSANLRHMADIFKRQDILYAHHGTLTGDYWCYYKDTRMWRRRNQTQTEAFIYKHVHEAIPTNAEIDFSKIERLSRLILRQACEEPLGFRGGAGWAFKDGTYGIVMNDLFMDRDWTPDASVRTLQKDDHIFKLLPITYAQWQDSKDTQPAKFLQFLESTCEEDYEVMDLLKEFCGYILGDSYYLHKFLIIEGLPGSGKSILGRILYACVGPQFFVATSLGSLGGRFGLGGMGGKKLAMMSEARSVDFAQLRAAVPVLLKITGNDYVNTEVKQKSELTEQLDVKIIIQTNRIPVLPDDTGALAQRLLLIKFNTVFRGTDKEILGLDDIIIKTELAGVIRFFLEGLAQLSKRKKFTEPQSGASKAMKETILQQIDPLKTFLSRYFVVNPRADRDDLVTQTDFLKYFRAYCFRLNQDTDRARIRRRASIRHIQTLLPAVDKRRLKRTQDGTAQPWVLTGITPLTQFDMEFAQELLELNTAEAG